MNCDLSAVQKRPELEGGSRMRPSPSIQAAMSLLPRSARLLRLGPLHCNLGSAVTGVCIEALSCFASSNSSSSSFSSISSNSSSLSSSSGIRLSCNSHTCAPPRLRNRSRPGGDQWSRRSFHCNASEAAHAAPTTAASTAAPAAAAGAAAGGAAGGAAGKGAARRLGTTFKGEGSRTTRAVREEEGGLSGMPPTGWVLLCCGLSLIGGGVAGGLWLLLDKPEPLKLAWDAVQKDPRVLEALGGSVTRSAWWGGYVHETDARIKMSLKATTNPMEGVVALVPEQLPRAKQQENFRRGFMSCEFGSAHEEGRCEFAPKQQRRVHLSRLQQQRQQQRQQQQQQQQQQQWCQGRWEEFFCRASV
ncbi:hypothetical protein Emed_003922 [Eimeria media]